MIPSWRLALRWCARWAWTVLLVVGAAQPPPLVSQTAVDSSVTYRDMTIQLSVPLVAATARGVYILQHDSAGRVMNVQTGVCIFGVLQDSALVLFPTPTWAWGATDCIRPYVDWRAHRK